MHESLTNITPHSHSELFMCTLTTNCTVLISRAIITHRPQTYTPTAVHDDKRCTHVIKYREAWGERIRHKYKAYLTRMAKVKTGHTPFFPSLQQLPCSLFEAPFNLMHSVVTCLVCKAWLLDGALAQFWPDGYNSWRHQWLMCLTAEFQPRFAGEKSSRSSSWAVAASLFICICAVHTRH